MSRNKLSNRQRIKYRVRKKVNGTSDRPRLSVYRSNTNIYAQIIDDSLGRTLVSASSFNDGDKKKLNINIDAALQVGKKLAQNAKDAGIKSVVFDRNGYQYHGKIKALADGAREGGLDF